MRFGSQIPFTVLLLFFAVATNARDATADVYLKSYDRYGAGTPSGATCIARGRQALVSTGFTKIGTNSGTGSYQVIYGQIGNIYKAKVVCVTISGRASYNINIAGPVKDQVENLVTVFRSILGPVGARATSGGQGAISTD